MKTFEINGHHIEFIEEQHLYIVDGVLTPCVSNILAYKFNDYGTVPQEILQRASERGTQLHEAIESYERDGTTSDLREFKNYLFLKKHHRFTNIANEVPVIYEKDGTVLFVGTLDQVIEMDGKCGINDFKRVSAPNKQKITYQLNFYKLAYEQTYNKTVDFLSYTHLRETVRKFNLLPINEEVTLNLLNEFLESERENGSIGESN